MLDDALASPKLEDLVHQATISYGHAAGTCRMGAADDPPSRVAGAFERWCDLVAQAEPLLLLPLERAHVSEARSLPALRDPFDRLIAGTAVALGVPLVTPDARMATAERVAVIW
jgi:hypothetical protein